MSRRTSPRHCTAGSGRTSRPRIRPPAWLCWTASCAIWPADPLSPTPRHFQPFAESPCSRPLPLSGSSSILPSCCWSSSRKKEQRRGRLFLCRAQPAVLGPVHHLHRLMVGRGLGPVHGGSGLCRRHGGLLVLRRARAGGHPAHGPGGTGHPQRGLSDPGGHDGGPLFPSRGAAAGADDPVFHAVLRCLADGGRGGLFRDLPRHGL